jgi:hypothetical protein
MESININNHQTRRLSGRSISIENAIGLLKAAIETKSKNVFETDVLNNTLPNEIRSIAWRIFLNILPVDQSTNDWVGIAKSQRAQFAVFSAEKEIDEFSRMIRGESTDNEILHKSELWDIYKLAREELDRISSTYDFFKSQIVAESLLRLYLIWAKQYTGGFDTKAFYILAGLIYTLYPSILHVTTPILDENLNDPQWLFNYLNDEEFFDSDVFFIFDNLMNHKQIKHIASEFKNSPRADIIEVEKRIIDSENIDMEYVATLSRFEKISYYYLRLINPTLTKYLFSIKLDVHEVLQAWIPSLLTSTISFERLTYFWDNIFYNCRNDSLDFVDHLSISLINNLSGELIVNNLVDNKISLMKYPDTMLLDEKEIVKKAMKLNEKLNE